MDKNSRADGAVARPSLESIDSPPTGAAQIIRDRLNANLPIIIFLGFYFVATVLGNFIYHTSWGANWARSSTIEGSDFSKLPMMKTLGYWILLLMPFLIGPPLAIFCARVSQGLLSKIAFSALEFRRSDYLLITGTAYAYCYSQFRRSNVSEIRSRGTIDVFASVAERFEIVETLGFWPLMVMKSVLVFLAVYSLVRAMRSREWFWIGAFLINLIVLSEMLIWLNMKWPVLVYYVALVICIFLFSQRHPFRNTTIAVVALGVMYLVISVMVLRFAEAEIVSRQLAAGASNNRTGELVTQQPQRLSTETSDTRTRSSPGTTKDVLAKPPEPVLAPIGSSEYAARVGQQAVTRAPPLLMNALNRMALPYPFYYQVFTEEGPICGTLIDRILRKTNPCHPSNLIYERIYGQGAFSGKATAPAAVHISGYALGGWTGALIATILTSIVIGLFMGLWPAARTSTLAATIFVMGGYSAYFFSQLPFEGPIVYDHGILWWAALLLGYFGYRVFVLPLLSKAVSAPIGK